VDFEERSAEHGLNEFLSKLTALAGVKEKARVEECGYVWRSICDAQEVLQLLLFLVNF
jgi:hypothetical protein